MMLSGDVFARKINKCLLFLLCFCLGGEASQSQMNLLPRNLTWNLKMMVSKRNLLFQGLLFRFNVKFQACRRFNLLGLGKSSILKGAKQMVKGERKSSLQIENDHVLPPPPLETNIALGFRSPKRNKYLLKTNFQGQAVRFREGSS